MKGSLVAGAVVEPYAQALMSLAQTSQLVDRFGEDVMSILELLKSSADLQQFLVNPLIKADSKKAVIRQLLGERVHSYVLNFLMILVDRRRIVFLEEVCQQFRALLRQSRQTVLAEVVSVVELTDDQKRIIRDKVISMTGAREVELETVLDPEIIGGVIVKVGSQVIDASLRGQLRRISFKLLSGSAV